MKIKLIGTLLVCPLLLPAQSATTEPQQPENTMKIVRVHGNAQVIGRLLTGTYVSGTQYTVSDELKAIVLTGKPVNVARVEHVIQELDTLNAVTPAASTERNIETTVYVISGAAESITGVQDGVGEALAPVVKQLRAIFPYNHYQLLSTMLIRSAQQAKTFTEGMMTSLPSDVASAKQSAHYAISYDAAGLHGSPPSIQLAGFRFESNGEHWQVSIRTDIDLHEGQKVIVGKANVGNSDTCIFLVLSARLVP